MIKSKYILLLLILSIKSLSAQPVEQFDVCVYGGTSGGVMAAYTVKQSGKKVVLIEPGKHLGGLTTGGLGYTDIGNKYAITGISRNFYRRIGAHYGKLEQWIFEPHVAEQTFLRYINAAHVKVLYQHRLLSVKKTDGKINEITIENTSETGTASHKVIRAAVFIDCSYEGDLMAKAGVSYFTGREDNSLFKETYNGVQMRDKHQFPDGVDPYKIQGDPKSGLLWGISDAALNTAGKVDKKVQAYNFRICLTNKPANRIPITKPEAYDADRYELLLRYLDKKPAKDLWAFLKFDLMPNDKTDINNNGPFSTDMIGMSYDFPDAGYATREKIQLAHESYVKGFLFFIGHDERMPEHLRKLMLEWGYPRDEYTDNGNWTPQMYVREARRMKGAYVMTQANCEAKEIVTDGVGMAAYTMDSHNCQRLVVNGMVKNEGDVQVGGFGPYPIAYRSLTPKASECKNLLVPVCLSATHIAYGSIRMEPVFMVLSQSAAVAAVLAINKNTSVQDVDIKELQQVLLKDPLADKSTPEILVDNDDKDNILLEGNWLKEGKGSYGPSMFLDDGKEGTLKSVTFKPPVVKAGKYQVYVYFPKLTKASTITRITVFDGQSVTEVKVKESDVRVQGQTAGEWVPLGNYHFPTGKKCYIKISNNEADGPVVADAVLLVPVFK